MDQIAGTAGVARGSRLVRACGHAISKFARAEDVYALIQQHSSDSIKLEFEMLDDSAAGGGAVDSNVALISGADARDTCGDGTDGSCGDAVAADGSASSDGANKRSILNSHHDPSPSVGSAALGCHGPEGRDSADNNSSDFGPTHLRGVGVKRTSMPLAIMRPSTDVLKEPEQRAL